MFPSLCCILCRSVVHFEHISTQHSCLFRASSSTFFRAKFEQVRAGTVPVFQTHAHIHVFGWCCCTGVARMYLSCVVLVGLWHRICNEFLHGSMFFSKYFRALSSAVRAHFCVQMIEFLSILHKRVGFGLSSLQSVKL